MLPKIKTAPKVIIVFGLLLAVFFGLRHFGLVSLPSDKSEVPKQASLPSVPDSLGAVVAAVDLPSTKPALKGHALRMQVWAWNAQMGLLFANGGKRTTENSLMAQHGIDLSITREDDTAKMAASLMALAQGVKSANDSPEGTHFIAIMGDGTPAYLAALNPKLKAICNDCIAEIIGSAGYSRGEDKLMGPKEWTINASHPDWNPKRALGSVIAGVILDGDWNIAEKWAGDNGLKNNPNETTWDPDALNWLSVDTYVDAAKKYIADPAPDHGVCETRKVARNGKITGETKEVCVTGVVTWTPGDVDVAAAKGGLVSIVSTKEYRGQMPNAIIGIRKFNRAHRKDIEEFLAAIFEGGDQVKSHPAALSRAAVISADVYGEQTAAYWEKYYKGVVEKDKQGLDVELGGSTVNNLADNLQLFGLTAGSKNIFNDTYSTFGDIAVQQYPKRVPTYPKFEDISDPSYLKALVGHVHSDPADLPKFAAGATMQHVVSKANWSITFDTGQASFSPEAKATLEKLAKDIAFTGLLIEIQGHTDNTGNAVSNMQLSQDRADAVKRWLMNLSATNFPDERFKVVAKGQTEPLNQNLNEAQRKVNRRVVIVMGSSS